MRRSRHPGLKHNKFAVRVHARIQAVFTRFQPVSSHDSALKIDPSIPSLIVIASRESRLAMWQATHIQSRLLALYPQCDVEIIGMTTRGDQILDRPL